MMTDTRAMSIRGIDLELYRWLKIEAAKHDHSMEAEVREILAEAKRQRAGDGTLGSWFDDHLKGTGGFDDLEIPPRSDSPARWVDFSE